MEGSGDDDVHQDVADAEVVGDNDIISCVKMKLASFCPDPALRAMINSAVLRTNNIVGETYAFANFHITRLLDDGVALPPINRTFYYACLASVATMNTRAATLSTEIVRSRVLFDALRPAGYEKIDATDLMDLMPDVSITMATMATNHLWMNLSGRLAKYLKWKHPELSVKMRKTVVMMVTKFPKMPLDKVDQLALVVKTNKKIKPTLPEELVTRRRAARELIVTLRARCQISSGTHVACRAHTLLPFFRFLHRETEANHVSVVNEPSCSTAKPKKTLSKKAIGRFTLLPTKRNYTVSCIPISSRFMFSMVKRLKRADGTPRFPTRTARGTDEEQRRAWEMFCNVNAVETRTRTFRNRVVSDGTSAAVVMNTSQACVQSNQNAEWDPSVLPKNKKINFAGGDPGITDVITATIQSKGQEDETVSYSSSRYYERSKVKLSGRRTGKWNAEMEAGLRQASDQSTMEGLSDYTASYLASVREMHDHRATKGYRNMRFMRYVFKQKAIQEICDMLAPPGEFTVVGFGDWSGPNGTPIKRRFTGPLQEIKRELKRRVDSVAFRTVWEYKTSVLCSQTWERMSNMVAKSWSRDRDKNLVEGKKSKVHKIMHCKTSDKGAARPDITTWNRDVNASRNILMLLMREIRGLERPTQFKPTQLPTRPVCVKASPGSNARGAVARGLSEGSLE